MSPVMLPDLPAEILSEIFKRLDWRTRIKCESVSRQFRHVLTEICTAASCPFADIPKQMTLVVTKTIGCKSRWSFDKKNRVLFREEESTIEGTTAFLKIVIKKWAPQIEMLEVRGLDLNSELVTVLSEDARIIPRFKFHKCRFDKIPLSKVAKIRNKIEIDQPIRYKPKFALFAQ